MWNCWYCWDCFCPLIVPLFAMTILSNFLKFRYLLDDKKSYQLAKEVSVFPLFMLIGPFLGQQLIWILSAAYDNNMYSSRNLAMNVFIYGLIIIDCCFLVVVIVGKCFSAVRGKPDPKTETEMELATIAPAPTATNEEPPQQTKEKPPQQTQEEPRQQTEEDPGQTQEDPRQTQEEPRQQTQEEPRQQTQEEPRQQTQEEPQRTQSTAVSEDENQNSNLKESELEGGATYS